VHAVPVAQPRAKASSFGGHTRLYTPTKTASGKTHPIAAFKATVQMAFRHACSLPPHDGAVMVNMAFILPRPLKLLKKSSPAERIKHTVKPDIDNLQKAVMDALSGLLFVDDRQVYSVLAWKWYSSKDEQPCVIIEAWRE
jgi:Holliday junction resolvase RusA-like endonuclease